MKKKELTYLNIIRFFAIVLVAGGHFIGTGTFATSIPEALSDATQLPLMPSDTHWLWVIEAKTVQNLDIQVAVIGVMLFFMITGYLCANMLNRYSRLQYTVGRFFRIFPSLWVVVLMLGVLLAILQNIKFDLLSYLATATLTQWIFLKVPTIGGLLWTVTAQLLFYIAMGILGKMSINKMIGLQIVSLMIIIVLKPFTVNYPAIFSLIFSVRFFPIMLIGTSFYLTANLNVASKNLFTLWSAAIALLSLIIFRALYGDTTTYAQVSTIAISLAIWVLVENIYNLPQMQNRNTPPYIDKFLRVSYPFYLSHVCIGFLAMYYAKLVGIWVYLLPVIAFASAIIFSALIHFLVEIPCAKIEKKVINCLLGKKLIENEGK